MRLVYIREWFFVVFSLVIHFLLLGLPLVNQEWVFKAGLLYFETNEPIFIEEYFYFQANTLGMSYFAFLIKYIFPFIKADFAVRILSVSSILLFFYALKRLNRIFETQISLFYLIGIFMLNPIIWVYTGRGTASVFPASLALLSISFLLDSKNRWSIFLWGLLFGVSVVLKYHSILLLPVVFLFRWKKELKLSNFFSFDFLLVLFSILLLPILYVIYIKFKFDFLFTPPSFQSAHAIKLDFMVTNFISYLGYLILLTFPISIYKFIEVFYRLELSRKLFVIITVVLSFGIGFTIHPQGEMNFGSLDSYIDHRLIGSLFSVLFVVFMVLLIYFIRQFRFENMKNIVIIYVTILLFMFALSFTRPAQRYLIFILPLFLLVLFYKTNLSKLIFYMSLVVFMVLNVYMNINQFLIGSTSQAMVKELIQKNLIAETYPNELNSHVGNYFFPYRDRLKKYKIVHTPSKKAIIVVQKKILFFSKTLCLVKIN